MALPFVGDLDVEGIHVQAPTDVVFLCGGQYTSVSEPEPVSLRDAFLKINDFKPLKGRDLIQAEDVTQLVLFSNIYQDLLEFETDLAQITELIVLFCESGGSLAELGAFSMVDEIASRLLVILRDKFWAEESFVKLGPLRFLERKYGADSVFVIDDIDIGINYDSVKKININILRDRLESPILARLNKSKDPTTFDSARSGHMIKLIVGLIQEYGALTASEIHSVLKLFSIDRDLKQISGYLLCAKSVDWVLESRKGSITYFVAKDVPDAATFITKPSAEIRNKVRRRAAIREHWKKSDPLRYNGITSVFSGSAR